MALCRFERCGVILLESTRIEFIGPGSMVNLESNPRSVILLGNVKLEALTDATARSYATWQRISWRSWIRGLREQCAPDQKIEVALQSLSIFFGPAVSRSLPSLVLAQLMNCDEALVDTVRQNYFKNWISSDRSPEPLSSANQGWQQISGAGWQTMLKPCTAAALTSSAPVSVPPKPLIASPPLASAGYPTFFGEDRSTASLPHSTYSPSFLPVY